MSRNKKKKRHPSLPPRLPLPMEELAGIVERAQGALSADEHTKLKAAMDTLASAMGLIAFLTSELQAKRTSLERLRHMLFGVKTEKTAEVLGEGAITPGPAGAAQTDKTDSGEGHRPRTPGPKAMGATLPPPTPERRKCKYRILPCTQGTAVRATPRAACTP